MHDDRLLTPGHTCWRTARAEKFAPIIDAADYFKHVKAAMLRARHRIMLIGWDFDSRVTFERGDKALPGPKRWLRGCGKATAPRSSSCLPVKATTRSSGARWTVPATA